MGLGVIDSIALAGGAAVTTAPVTRTTDMRVDECDFPTDDATYSTMTGAFVRLGTPLLNIRPS